MRSFPQLPSTHFEWVSLQWEPIAISGERLTAFVIVRCTNADSQTRVHSCITPKQTRCIFGENSKSITEILHFAESLLAEDLDNQILAELKLGFSGFHVGRMGSIYAESIAEATQIAVRESSLFGSASMLNFSSELVAIAEEQIESSVKQQEDRFYQLVHQLVTSNSPFLEQRFRKSFRLADNARGTRLDYAGNNLFANLHRLKPGRTLSQQIKIGKQKLLDLSSIRLWIADQNREIGDRNVQNFEMLTHRPTVPDIDHSENEIRQVNEAVEELTYAADHHELRLHCYDNFQLAANRILELEN